MFKIQALPTQILQNEGFRSFYGNHYTSHPNLFKLYAVDWRNGGHTIRVVHVIASHFHQFIPQSIFHKLQESIYCSAQVIWLFTNLLFSLPHSYASLLGFTKRPSSSFIFSLHTGITFAVEIWVSLTSTCKEEEILTDNPRQLIGCLKCSRPTCRLLLKRHWMHGSVVHTLLSKGVPWNISKSVN